DGGGSGFSGGAPGGARRVDDGAGDFYDRGVGEASVEARADGRAANSDRERRRDGNGGWGAAGRSRRDLGGIAELAGRGVPGYGTPFCGGIRRQERGRTGFGDGGD